jgi:hypothetical protein
MLRQKMTYGRMTDGEDNNQMVTLPATYLGNLMLAIYRQEAELRRFIEVRPARAARRSPHGFSPRLNRFRYMVSQCRVTLFEQCL